jgi:hypothetical protein
MDYEQKYIKYKMKYLKLKQEQYGGGGRLGNLFNRNKSKKSDEYGCAKRQNIKYYNIKYQLPVFGRAMRNLKKFKRIDREIENSDKFIFNINEKSHLISNENKKFIWGMLQTYADPKFDEKYEPANRNVRGYQDIIDKYKGNEKLFIGGKHDKLYETWNKFDKHVRDNIKNNKLKYNLTIIEDLKILDTNYYVTEIFFSDGHLVLLAKEKLKEIILLNNKSPKRNNYGIYGDELYQTIDVQSIFFEPTNTKVDVVACLYK